MSAPFPADLIGGYSQTSCDSEDKQAQGILFSCSTQPSKPFEERSLRVGESLMVSVSSFTSITREVLHPAPIASSGNRVFCSSTSKGNEPSGFDDTPIMISSVFSIRKERTFNPRNCASSITQMTGSSFPKILARFAQLHGHTRASNPSSRYEKSGSSMTPTRWPHVCANARNSQSCSYVTAACFETGVALL